MPITSISGKSISTIRNTIKPENINQIGKRKNIDLSGYRLQEDIMASHNEKKQSLGSLFMHKLFPRKRNFDPLLFEAKQKYPEETKELLADTILGQEYGERKLTANEISQLAPAMNKYHDAVKYLLKAERKDWYGNVGGLSASVISRLAPLMDESPKIVKSLLKKTERSVYKRDCSRFTFLEIEKLTPLMKKYPEEAKKLIDGLRISADTIRDFKTNEILELTPLLKEFPQQTEELLSEIKSVSPLGIPKWKYTTEEVISKIKQNS